MPDVVAEKSLFHMYRQLPKSCQMMLFSATYDEDVMNFAEAIIRNPVMLK